jgi:gliding motility-associated-like protein
MSQPKSIFLVFLLLLITALNLSATHIMGGELTYRYLDNKGNGGKPFRYLIQFDVYINCEQGSCCVDGIPQVDYNILNNDNNTFESRTIYANAGQVSSSFISECNCVSVACIKSQKFRDTVQLSTSFKGHEVFFEHCCRNGEIINLAQSGTMSFHTSIPPTIYTNSSPQFTDIATPFMCIGDTNTLYNAATDPDGDKLIFSMSQPLATFFPPKSFGFVGYASNFSQNDPFGPRGYAKVDASNGTALLQSSSLGNYVVSFEIKEYREINGVSTYLSSTRRDLQILVRRCSIRKPIISNTQVTYNIAGGDELCFDVDGYDLDNDSVTLSATGNILTPNSGYSGPLATFTTNKEYKNVKSKFCWQTDCKTFGEYQFTVKIKDNGCKELEDTKKFFINVKKQEEKEILYYDQKIAPDTLALCATANAPLKTLYDNDTIYDWRFDNTKLNINDSILPITKDGKYFVKIVRNGCQYQDSVYITQIEINEQIHKDTTICFGDTANLYSDIANDRNYSWTTIEGILLQELPKIKVYPTQTTKYIGNISRGKCVKKDTVTVAVLDQLSTDIKIERLNDALPQRIKFIDLGNGKTHLWNFGNGDSSTLSSPVGIFTQEGNYNVKLKVFNELGCHLIDSLMIPINNFLIPNIITPNQDGLNDDFKIANFGDQWSVKIYNRWGKLVFSDDTYHRGWSAEDVESGVYFYYITDTFYNKEYKGWLQVSK